MGATGNLTSERFNGGADGVSLTTGNSQADAFSGVAAVFSTTNPIQGSACCKFILNASSIVRFDLTTGTPLYITFYLRVEAVTSVARTTIMQVLSGATVRAALAITSAGKFDVRNGATNVYTSTASHPTGAYVRCRWKVDLTASSQTFDFFTGSNLNGSTPSESSGALALTNGSFDRVNFGTVALPSGNATEMRFDYFDIDNAAFAESYTKDLVVTDCSHGHTVDALTLTQDHSLTVADGSLVQTADSLALTQLHQLLVADASHEHTVEILTLTQVHVLTVADSALAHTAEALALIVDLAVADATMAHTADVVTILVLRDVTVLASLRPKRVDGAIAEKRWTAALRG